MSPKERARLMRDFNIPDDQSDDYGAQIPAINDALGDGAPLPTPAPQIGPGQMVPPRSGPNLPPELQSLGTGPWFPGSVPGQGATIGTAPQGGQMVPMPQRNAAQNRQPQPQQQQQQASQPNSPVTPFGLRLPPVSGGNLPGYDLSSMAPPMPMTDPMGPSAPLAFYNPSSVNPFAPANPEQAQAMTQDRRLRFDERQGAVNQWLQALQLSGQLRNQQGELGLRQIQALGAPGLPGSMALASDDSRLRQIQALGAPGLPGAMAVAADQERLRQIQALGIPGLPGSMAVAANQERRSSEVQGDAMTRSRQIDTMMATWIAAEGAAGRNPSPRAIQERRRAFEQGLSQSGITPPSATFGSGGPLDGLAANPALNPNPSGPTPIPGLQPQAQNQTPPPRWNSEAYEAARANGTLQQYLQSVGLRPPVGSVGSGQTQGLGGNHTSDPRTLEEIFDSIYNRRPGQNANAPSPAIDDAITNFVTNALDRGYPVRDVMQFMAQTDRFGSSAAENWWSARDTPWSSSVHATTRQRLRAAANRAGGNLGTNFMFGIPTQWLTNMFGNTPQRGNQVSGGGLGGLSGGR